MDAAVVLAWWQKERGFFSEHFPTALAQLDNDAARLQKLAAADEEVVVCVLGQAAVGKSTLLNALVARAETLLPAGGIGPLTALATQVRYSAEPYFCVRYQDARQLHGVRLALEAELRRQGRATALAQSPIDTPADAESALFAIDGDPDPRAVDDGGALTNAESNDVEHRQSVDRERRRRIDELTKLVCQVVKGDQFVEAEPSYLAQAIRSLLSGQPSMLAALDEVDRERIARASSCLAAGRGGKLVRYSAIELKHDFHRVLREHVSGFLAPLVEQIEVGWPSEILKNGLMLVDLPGVGIASDRYTSITSEFIRQKARAVVLVVDRAGPTDASVDLIRDSGYWDRLLLSSDDPSSDPCTLIVAVSKIDDVAREEQHQFDHLPSGQRPRLRDVFARLKDEVEVKIRAQARDCFSKLSMQPTQDEHVRVAREEAGKALLSALQVFPISATQYRDYYRRLDGDDEAFPFVGDPQQSGIPALQDYLVQLATAQREDRRQAREEVLTRLVRTISGSLDQAFTQWSENLQAMEEAVQLRQELEQFLEPKRLELANREGAFREFLDNTINVRIEELVAKAQTAAQQEIQRYLWALSDCHWATLRATVTRGGTFVSGMSRRVDLASDVAQRFQEPMAAVWSQTLLKQVRRRTQQHGGAIQQIVGEICDWVDDRHETHVQRQVLDAQKELIRDRVHQLGQVGQEAVDELKDAVKREMVQQIVQPIRSACQKFVERGDAYGSGVKRRILDLFHTLVDESVASAGVPTTNLLRSRFVEVHVEIVKALAEWGDPIDQTADAVVEREETRRRRSDAQRRTKILADLQQLRETAPTMQ